MAANSSTYQGMMSQYNQPQERAANYQADILGRKAAPGAARGKDMGEALSALQKAAGLPLLSSFGSSGTGAAGTAPAPVSYGGGGGLGPGGSMWQPPTSAPEVSYGGGTIAPPDTSAAHAASFGKAKATAGALGQSSLEGLRANLADRGILGSGTEARGLVDRLAAATNPLSDINAQQLSENVGITQKNQELQQQAQQTAYQGGITQRGQNLSAEQSKEALRQQAQNAAYSGAITQRGQDIQLREAQAARNQQALQGLLSAIGGFSQGLY